MHNSKLDLREKLIETISSLLFLWMQPKIDLHCHILPAIDDGAANLAVSLGMARASAGAGVTAIACTPHILPGLYNNSGSGIRLAVQQLQRALSEEGIPLRLVTGADNHMTPSFEEGIRSGHLLTLADSRYVLVEPPHHSAPVRLEDFFFGLLVAGYVPILTHPERLNWIKPNYPLIQRLVRAGAWMQITSGSLTGAFGRSAQYWAERMLDDGVVHLLATDAHDAKLRPPNLREGRDRAEKRVGAVEALHLTETRPSGVLANAPPSSLPMPGSTASSFEHAI
jgi:protein-tyrosine phosphatase